MILLALALAAAASTDGGYVVFDRGKAAALLQQCSRATPGIGEAGWTPMAGDILALEAALPSALSAQIKAQPALASAPHGWVRQYIGIVRGGRRYIYGNFAPQADLFKDLWRTEPVINCDGGSMYFGAEYDVLTKKFTQFAFNGSLG